MSRAATARPAIAQTPYKSVSDSSRNNLRSPRMHPSIQNKLNPMVVSIALYAAFVTTPKG